MFNQPSPQKRNKQRKKSKRRVLDETSNFPVQENSPYSEIMMMQSQVGNQATRQMLNNGTLNAPKSTTPLIQKMPENTSAEAWVPISDRQENKELRTVIINMVAQFNNLYDNYEANFPEPNNLQNGGADRYFQRTVAQLKSLATSIRKHGGDYKSNLEKVKNKSILKKKLKYETRIGHLTHFLSLVDDPRFIQAGLNDRHHQKLMTLMSQNTNLDFLTSQNQVGERQEGAAKGGIHTLGKGTVNTNEGQKTGYFKTDEGKADDAGGGMHIEHHEAKQSLRSVATFEVSELLGMGIIPYTALTKGEDEEGKVVTGQFMEEAKGVTGRGKIKGDEIPPQDYAKLQQLLEQLKDPNVSSGDRQGIENEVTGIMGHHGTTEIDGKQYKLDIAATDIDWMNPLIQKDLSTMQLFDVLVAHADRHPENYVVNYDPETDSYGGVKGIDNDSTWGKRGTEKFYKDKGSFGYKAKTKTPSLPPVIDAEIALKVLSTPWNAIQAILVKYDMSPAEIEAALSRWQFVIEGVKTMIRAGSIATMGMKEEAQIDFFAQLYQLMDEPLPNDLMQRRMMLWGEQTKALQNYDNSYAAQQQEAVEELHTSNKETYKPWEKETN